MTLDLTRSNTTSPEPTPGSCTRHEPETDDAEGLARLMLDAYRGTIDDGGETLDEAKGEVAKLLAGQYGQLDRGASSLFSADGTFVAATIITRDATKIATGEAFLAFSMTAPNWKRRGLARVGLVRAISVLSQRGEPRLHLLVTQGNEPAARLYRDLGFVVTQSK